MNNEDIKVLEEFKDYIVYHNNIILSYETTINLSKAIENLIKGYKELEEENEVIKITRKDLPKDTNIILMTREDFERNFGNEYIHKDKIKELINKRGNEGYTSLDCIEDILELLEERN